MTTWDGYHCHGVYSWKILLSPLSTWVHLDWKHALNNALLGVWVFYQVQQQHGYKKGLLLGIFFAIQLVILEEFVHLWSPLPATIGASSWILAFLPLCMDRAWKMGLCKSFKWWFPFSIFVILEDLLIPAFFGNLFTESGFLHLLGLIVGCLWVPILRSK